MEAAKGDEALDEPEGARQGSVYDALAKTEAAKETQPIAVSGDSANRVQLCLSRFSGTLRIPRTFVSLVVELVDVPPTVVNLLFNSLSFQP